jgi:hypothetical protein
MNTDNIAIALSHEIVRLSKEETINTSHTMIVGENIFQTLKNLDESFDSKGYTEDLAEKIFANEPRAV